MFTASQLKALQDAFLADSTSQNPMIFLPKGTKGTALNKQNGKNHFIAASNAWWDPIRELLKD
jgi:phosphonate transport system substrate-binding protein